MADRLSAFFRVVWLGMISSLEDYRRMFTWHSWALGWLSRLLAQVLFFALLGRIVGTAADEQYIAIGNALVLAPLGTLGVVSSATLERRLGTLQLLLLAPANPLVVIVSRGLYWLFDGLLTSLVTLTLVSTVLGLDVHWGNWPLIVVGQLVIASCAYAMAVAMAGLSIRWPEARTFVTSIMTILLLSSTGVNASAPRLENGAAALAHLLPVTNGLPAVRAAVSGEPLTTDMITHLMAECLVGLTWMLLAHITVITSIRRQVRSGRLTTTA
jgi:ABC-2 type transport system permease protein